MKATTFNQYEECNEHRVLTESKKSAAFSMVQVEQSEVFMAFLIQRKSCFLDVDFSKAECEILALRLGSLKHSIRTNTLHHNLSAI